MYTRYWFCFSGELWQGFLPSFLLFFLPSVYHVSIAVIQTKSLGRYCLSYMCLDLENFEGSASSTQWIWGTEGVHGGHQGVILRILLQEGPSALSRLYWGTGLSWNVMPFSDWLSCRHPSHPRSHTLGSSCIQWHPNWGGKEVILAPELPVRLAKAISQPARLVSPNAFFSPFHKCWS